MNLELKVIIIAGLIGGVCAVILGLIFNKYKIGKKETREEIEEKNFGKK